MLDTLKTVLKEQVRDLYSAENQLVKALPKMVKAANSESLKDAFNAHLEETKVHVERLQQIANILEAKPSGKTCKAMAGLIEEGKEAIEEKGEPPCIDIALVAAAQRVEHYEISAYGTARAIAEQLGEAEIVLLLQSTLDDEAAADEKLTDLCTGELLIAAALGHSNGDSEIETAAPKSKRKSR